MKRKELLKKLGIVFSCCILCVSPLKVMAESAETEVITEVTTEAVGEMTTEVAALSGEVTETATGTITKLTTAIIKEEENKGAVEFFLYTPSDVKPIGPSTPVLLYYGDGKMDAQSVEAKLAEAGLDVLAEAENCSVLFVNPIGESWGEKDQEAYLYGLVDLFSEDTGSETGKNADGTKIIGTSQRICIVAEGSGADFTAEYLARETMKKFNIFMDFYYVPAGVMLFNTAKDSVNCEFGIAAVISKDPISKEAVQEGWDSTISKVRRQTSGLTEKTYEILPVHDYEAEGISVSIENAEINGASMEWYEYIPENLNLSGEGNVPLVFTFHGGGNHAQYQANASEWPLVGKENGFIVVAVNQHVERTANDIVELLKVLEEKYPCIDQTRIYASGFSMGAIKSWDLGTQYPELFAGIAPMDAVKDPEADVKNTIIPTYYLAGEEDGLLVFPHQVAFGGEGGEGNGDYILQHIFEMNEIAYPGYDENKNAIWGMEFTKTRKVATENPNHVITENYVVSADGNTYTVLATMSNQAHAVLSGSSYAAWDFLKQFSRNTDGTISIAK